MGGKVLLQSHIKIHLIGNIGINSVDIDLGDQMAKALHQTWQTCDVVTNESMRKTWNLDNEHPSNLMTKVNLDNN